MTVKSLNVLAIGVVVTSTVRLLLGKSKPPDRLIQALPSRGVEGFDFKNATIMQFIIDVQIRCLRPSSPFQLILSLYTTRRSNRRVSSRGVPGSDLKNAAKKGVSYCVSFAKHNQDVSDRLPRSQAS